MNDINNEWMKNKRKRDLRGLKEVVSKEAKGWRSAEIKLVNEDEKALLLIQKDGTTEERKEKSQTNNCNILL